MKDYSLRNDNIKLIHALATSIGEHMTELFENGYDQGYEDGKAATPFTDTEEAKKTAYEQGLNDAWDAAKKLCQSVKYGGIEEYCSEIFEITPFETFDVFDYTASEAIAKIKVYEDKQKQDAEIKVGDEVTHDGAKFIVLNIDSQTSVYCLDTRGRTPIFTNIHNLTKTGRHFGQIAEVLKQMNREEDK